MTQFSVKLNIVELELLANLASDQLFRREFIDPKMPGQKANPGQIAMGKELVARLRSLQNPDAARKTAPLRKLHAV
jgi:hypothetical protein